MTMWCHEIYKTLLLNFDYTEPSFVLELITLVFSIFTIVAQLFIHRIWPQQQMCNFTNPPYTKDSEPKLVRILEH